MAGMDSTTRGSGTARTVIVALINLCPLHQSACGMVTLRASDQDAAPVSADTGTIDATHHPVDGPGPAEDASIVADASLDAQAPDAQVPDAAIPGCDQVVRLDRNMQVDSLPIPNGAIRGSDPMYMSTQGAGVIGGIADDFIEALPGERMIVEWSPAARSVRYMLTGGMDGDQDGVVWHTRRVNGVPITMGGADAFVVEGSVSTLELQGALNDGFRVGELRYSICR